MATGVCIPEAASQRDPPSRAHNSSRQWDATSVPVMAEEAREESVQERLANPQPASEKFAEPRPDVSARDAVAPGDPPSAAHALISGLRLTGDEAQFTQVIAAVARADPGFAGELVALILKTASKEGTAAANARTTFRGASWSSLRRTGG